MTSSKNIHISTKSALGYVLAPLNIEVPNNEYVQLVKMTKGNTMVLFLVGLTLLGSVQVQSFWIPGSGLRMDCKA